MPNKEPLDMSQFVDEDIDTEYQLDITKPSETKPQLEIPPERNPKYAKLLDHELDEEITKYEHYIKTLNLNPETLEKAIEALKKEKLVRECENKRKEQADGSGSQSKDHVAIGPAFSEECVLLNPSKEKGSFTKRSPNTEASPVCGRKNASRIFSGDLAGPSPRPGLRSGSKRCSRCGGSSIDSPCNACRFYRKPPKRHFAAKESPERNSSPGPSRKGNGGKRARQSVGGEDSLGKVVELCSSDDEDVKVTQETSADCQIPLQRKVYGTRSTLSPSMEGVRIAYPSRDDPEAVEVAWHDLHRLEPMEFLNDTVIDFYIKYIQRPEVLTQEEKSKFYFFNSFFYKKLTELVGGQNKKTLADLTKLRKWTKGTNIFEKEYLFVPIHDKWHWSLAIVCHPGAPSEDTCSQRCILHLDSMSPGHKSNNVFRLLRTYLIAEWEHQADKDGSSDSVEKLKNEDFPVKKIPVPQQENESDCGLFLLHYIERFLREAPSAFKLSDVDQLLFGRNWFKPSQASGLRQEIQQLLLNFFEKETSRAKENAETIERTSVQHQEPENMLMNNVQQVNHSDVEVNNDSCFPGQCLAAELVHEHNVPAPSTPKFDSAGGSTPSGLLAECTEQHLDSEGKRFSQANCGSPRNSTQLPLASILEFSADFVSGDSRRQPLSGGLVENSEEVNTLLQSKNNNRDVGEDNNSGIPLVVDLPIQDEQRSAD